MERPAAMPAAMPAANSAAAASDVFMSVGRPSASMRPVRTRACFHSDGRFVSSEMMRATTSPAVSTSFFLRSSLASRKKAKRLHLGPSHLGVLHRELLQIQQAHHEGVGLAVGRLCCHTLDAPEHEQEGRHVRRRDRVNTIGSD
eukprot:5093451-Prymnesium_polylepis.1